MLRNFKKALSLSILGALIPISWALSMMKENSITILIWFYFLYDAFRLFRYLVEQHKVRSEKRVKELLREYYGVARPIRIFMQNQQIAFNVCWSVLGLQPGFSIMKICWKHFHPQATYHFCLLHNILGLCQLIKKS